LTPAGRGALWAALRLALVLAALAAFAVWWRQQMQPDYRVERRLRLLPERAEAPAAAVDLGGRLLAAYAIPCGRTLEFGVQVPGEDPVLRFSDGHVTAHPELALRLLAPDGSARELEVHATTENAWTLRRVPLPASAGERVTIQLAALDGAGRPGLGAVLVADVVLESAGRGVDETVIPVASRAAERDLLSDHLPELVLAPGTRESLRIGVEGPQALPLEDGQPFRTRLDRVPPGARLDLVLHLGQPWPDAPPGVARVEVLAGDALLATVDAQLPGPAARSHELSASVDLAPFAGQPLDLALLRAGAPALWVGVRELVLSVPHAVPRRRFVAGQGRNVLLLVVDSLRGERLGCAGWEPAATPVIDGLAARGGRWTRVLAPSSWSLPNVASLLTGVSPLTHGLGVLPRVRLSSVLPTLAQSAALGGFATACFSGTPVTGPQHGLDRGFERAEVVRLAADALAERALDWLEDASQFEWFLMLHATDPSFPHEPSIHDVRALRGGPPAALVERLRALDSRPGAAEALALELGTRYDAELAGVDRALGRITDWLAARDLLRGTLVVVVGSSGEEFFEHGGRLHGQTLWDEVVTVPVVMCGPGIRGPAGGAFVEDEPISLLDVTRILGEHGRLSVKTGMQGRLPPPFGPRLPEPVFHALLRPIPGLTTADLDASRTRRWLRLLDHATGREALFDQPADPASRHDLLSDATLGPERRAAARLEADALAASHAEWVRSALLLSAAQAEPAGERPP
jgi:hypothetical protein